MGVTRCPLGVVDTKAQQRHLRHRDVVRAEDLRARKGKAAKVSAKGKAVNTHTRQRRCLTRRAGPKIWSKPV